MRLTSGSPQEIRAMNSMIEKGPVTMMLVFRSTCPHCVTYKPIWEELCKTKGRTANMISMESDIYQKTPLGSEKPVTGVPTVLYVSPTGAIS
jgi:thiol-disulfide isomerase/thioredoxin